MKEVFEHAYQGISDLIIRFTDFSVSVGRCVLVGLIYITFPLWIVPYAIHKKLKGGEE